MKKLFCVGAMLIGWVAVRSVRWLRGEEVATQPAPEPQLAQVR